jgi:hypothetical protein
MEPGLPYDGIEHQAAALTITIHGKQRCASPSIFWLLSELTSIPGPYDEPRLAPMLPIAHLSFIQDDFVNDLSRTVHK